MEQPLPDALALYQRPVVVPSGQKVDGVESPRDDRQVIA
jgi:hypothetical protein